MDLSNPIIKETLKKGWDNLTSAWASAEHYLDDVTGYSSLPEQKKQAIDMAINYSPAGMGTIYKAFHGTNVPIKAFNKEFLGSSTGAKSAKAGFWFVDNPEVAQSYSTYAAETAPVKKLIDQADTYERIANKTGSQKYYDKYDKTLEQAEKLESDIANNRFRGQNIIPAELDIKNPKIIDAKGNDFYSIEEDINKQIKEAKSKGYDGLVIKNLDDSATFSNRPATHYLVFEPTQIKSSISKQIMAEEFLDK